MTTMAKRAIMGRRVSMAGGRDVGKRQGGDQKRSIVADSYTHHISLFSVSLALSQGASQTVQR